MRVKYRTVMGYKIPAIKYEVLRIPWWKRVLMWIFTSREYRRDVRKRIAAINDQRYKDARNVFLLSRPPPSGTGVVPPSENPFGAVSRQSQIVRPSLRQTQILGDNAIGIQAGCDITDVRLGYSLAEAQMMMEHKLKQHEVDVTNRDNLTDKLNTLAAEEKTDLRKLLVKSAAKNREKAEIVASAATRLRQAIEEQIDAQLDPAVREAKETLRELKDEK